MRARMFCRTGEFAGSDHALDTEATIGSAAQNTIVLAHRMVSRQHARLTFEEGEGAWVLEDLQSINGTRLDNMPVKGRERLGPLHVITLAERHDFIFMIEPARIDVPSPAHVSPASDETMSDVADLRVPAVLVTAPAAPDASGETIAGGISSFAVPSALLAAPGAPAADESAGQWVLEVGATTRMPSRAYPLAEGTYTIGRVMTCDIRLDDATVSRRHAVITVLEGRVTITDLDSANGTFVDDVPLKGAADARAGMAVRFGEVVATIAQRTT